MRPQLRRIGSLVAGAALLLAACGGPSATSSGAPVAPSAQATTTASAIPTATPFPVTAPPARTAAPSATPVPTAALAPSPTAVPTAAPTAAAATIQDKIVEPSETNYLSWTYAPDTLTIHVGDHVVWTNTGQAAHTVTADGGTFDSGSLNTGQTWTFVFSKAGTYAYHCTFHPWMKGTVIVVP